jgi:hypothetical protein
MTTSDRYPNQSLTFSTVDQQIRLHALNVAVSSRQAIATPPDPGFADQVLLDAAKYEAFLRGSAVEMS